MKNPPKKGLQQKLQNKEYFLRKITTISTLCSCDLNFKKATFFKGEIRRILFHFSDYFQSCFEPGLRFFLIQNQKEPLDDDLLVISVFRGRGLIYSKILIWKIQ